MVSFSETPVKDSELFVHSATEQTRKYTGDKGTQDLERTVTKNKGMKDKMNPAVLIRNEREKPKLTDLNIWTQVD